MTDPLVFQVETLGLRRYVVHERDYLFGLRRYVVHERDYLFGDALLKNLLPSQRDQLRDMGWSLPLSPKGGRTIVVLYPAEEYGRTTYEYTYVGIAECSEQDNFDRKRGLLIATGRAIKKAMAA